jgi:hypothetical protein
VLGREPKSVQCALAVLVDDLLRAYMDGYSVRDASLLEGDPTRDFRMRVCVLNWIGDYQGQGKIANMKHCGQKGCHWCMQHFRRGLGQSGSNFADNTRRYLPPRSPLRDNADCGTDRPLEEDNCPPRNRSHDTIWATGWEITCGNGTKKEKEDLAIATGINGLCVLGLLPFFDICMDICLDMMHVLKNIWQEHLIKLFKGLGKPKRPEPRKEKKKTKQEIQTDRATYREQSELYREIAQVRNTTTRTSTSQH